MQVLLLLYVYKYSVRYTHRDGVGIDTSRLRSVICMERSNIQGLVSYVIGTCFNNALVKCPVSSVIPDMVELLPGNRPPPLQHASEPTRVPPLPPTPTLQIASRKLAACMFIIETILFFFSPSITSHFSQHKYINLETRTHTFSLIKYCKTSIN